MCIILFFLFKSRVSLFYESEPITYFIDCFDWSLVHTALCSGVTTKECINGKVLDQTHPLLHSMLTRLTMAVKTHTLYFFCV